MAVAYFGRIKPNPITISVPYPHVNDFGWYVSNIYTAYTGYTFDRVQWDASGNAAYGAYGHCTDGGGAWAWRIADYAQRHGLGGQFFDTATLWQIQQELNAGNPVVLSTYLSSAGHLILVKGYIPGTNTIIGMCT